jgi:hypothetical protein
VLDDLDRQLGADPDDAAPAGSLGCYEPALPPQAACDPGLWPALRVRADERRREWLGPIGDALRDLERLGLLRVDRTTGMLLDPRGGPLDRAHAELLVSAVSRPTGGEGSPARA